jgi:hypothetical protein
MEAVMIVISLQAVMAAAFVFTAGAQGPAPGRTDRIAGAEPRAYHLAQRRDLKDDDDAAWQKFGPSNNAARNKRNDDDQSSPRRPFIEDRASRAINDRGGGSRSRDPEDERLRGRNYRD